MLRQSPQGPIELLRRRRPLTVWGGRIVPSCLLLLGLAVCTAALAPLSLTFWVLFGAAAEILHRRVPDESYAVLAAVLSAWAWILVWAQWAEALQASLVERNLAQRLSTEGALFVRVRHGSRGNRLIHDLGFLRVAESRLRFDGDRSAFSVSLADLPDPAFASRADTVFLRVGAGKGGIFFGTRSPQELVRHINEWRSDAEVVQSVPVDKPGGDG